MPPPAGRAMSTDPPIRRPPPGTAADRDAQRRHWDDVARRWWDWHGVMEAATRPVSEHLVALARIGPGARVVDVASGLGEPALTAAAHAGPGGLVVATDLSGAMLGRAAARAREARLSRFFCVRMDATRPALRAGAFDAVLCRWGLMAFPDLAEGLAGLRALLRSGGRLAAAVWGAPEAAPAIALPLTVMRAAAGLAPPAAGERGPFRLADPERVADALARAGFGGVERSPAEVVYRFASVDEFIAYSRGTSSPVAALAREAPDLDEDAGWRAVRAEAGRLAAPDGSLVLVNRTDCWSAVA
jgi:ubiquinone/menaquinone biosynthesis C-methylase UbiE